MAHRPPRQGPPPFPDESVFPHHDAVSLIEAEAVDAAYAKPAKAHPAMAHGNLAYYDLDTCLGGQKADPMGGGARCPGTVV